SPPANGADAIAAKDAPNGAAAPPADAPGEASDQPTEAAPATVGDAPPAVAAEAAMEKWEEVWRPRRKGGALDRGERESGRHRGRRKEGVHAPRGTQDALGPAPKPMRHEGKGPLRRRDHRRKGSNQRDERSRPHLQASPSPPKAAFD